MGVSLEIWHHSGDGFERYERSNEGFSDLRAAIAKAAAEVGTETFEQVRPLVELDTFDAGSLDDEQCQEVLRGLIALAAHLSAEHAEDCVELSILLSRVAGSGGYRRVIAR